MTYSMSLTLPENFKSALEVAGCFCEYEGKILYLKRHPEKHQGNFWGIPGGKLDPNESPEEAVIREISEETGLVILPEDLEYIGPEYARHHLEYIFLVYRAPLRTEPTLNIGLAEHTEGRWVTITEALGLPLMAGGKEALNHYVDHLEKHR